MINSSHLTVDPAPAGSDRRLGAAGRPAILALWSVPRARSTAFLRMMAQRGDLQVVHEPFSQLADFGRLDIDGRTVRSEAELIAALRRMAARGPVFFKDTTDFEFPGLLSDQAFLREAVHTFTVRRPDAVIASHFALNPDLGLEDVGFGRLARIHDAVAEACGRRPVVFDSDDLLADPAGLIAAYCDATGLDFDPAALEWEPGLLPDWERTARWHSLTSRTAGFSDLGSQYPDTVWNHPVLAAYFEHHRPLYSRLCEHRLAPAGKDPR